MNQAQNLSEAERLSLVVEIWKKTVDVQQHFNDIELRIRNIAITVLGALLGAAAFSMKEALTISFYGSNIFVGKLILAAAMVTWIAFYFMDRHWYHRLLMGAVYLGKYIEERNKDVLPEMDLTSEIKKASLIRIFKWELHSDDKMDIFYGVILVLLFIAFFGLGGPIGRGDAEGEQQKMTGPTVISESNTGNTSIDSTTVWSVIPAISEDDPIVKKTADEPENPDEGNQDLRQSNQVQEQFTDPKQ